VEVEKVVVEAVVDSLVVGVIHKLVLVEEELKWSPFFTSCLSGFLFCLVRVGCSVRKKGREVGGERKKRAKIKENFFKITSHFSYPLSN
jgi:hypothetical protein